MAEPYCGEGVRFAADVTHVYRNGGGKPYIFIPSSITRAVKRENYSQRRACG